MAAGKKRRREGGLVAHLVQLRLGGGGGPVLLQLHRLPEVLLEGFVAQVLDAARRRRFLLEVVAVDLLDLYIK